MENKEIHLKTDDGNEVVLKPDILIRGMACLLNLAPAALRTPEDFLEDCYKQKIALKMLSQSETVWQVVPKNRIEMLNEKHDSYAIVNETDYDCKKYCHVFSTCKSSVQLGDDECIKRRSDLPK